MNTTNLYVTFDPSNGEITISAYSIDSPEWENNHMTLVELRNGKPNIHESVMNIVRNIFSQANIVVMWE